MHTLCLLDIKVKEVSEENMMRGKTIYESPRFMSVNEALEQIEETIGVKGVECEGLVDADTMVVGLARVRVALLFLHLTIFFLSYQKVGQPTQQIVYGSLRELKEVDFGGPLHCVVIPGTLHDLEQLCLQSFGVSSLQK